MKRKILFFVVVSFGMILYAQSFDIFQVIPQGMISDKSVLRYNVLNAFDDDDTTVFAVNAESIDFKKPVIKILLSNIVNVNALQIKSGYFDSKYYKANSRIKTLRIGFINKESEEVISKQYVLEDTMTIQTIKFDKTYTCSEIYIYVDDILLGDKWNDLVVTDIGFLLNGKLLGIAFVPSGSLAFVETYYNYEYLNGKLNSEYDQYGKAGSDEAYYFYNPEGKLTFRINSSMSEPETEEYTVITYKSVLSDKPNMEITYFNTGELNYTKTYFYDDGKLIREEISGKKSEIVKYYYVGNSLVRVEKYEKDSKTPALVTIYYYENSICIAELYEYNKTKVSYLYKYIYNESGQLLCKIPVLSKGYGMYGDGSEAYPGPELYIYKDGSIISKRIMVHSRDYGY